MALHGSLRAARCAGVFTMRRGALAASAAALRPQRHTAATPTALAGASAPPATAATQRRWQSTDPGTLTPNAADIDIDEAVNNLLYNNPPREDIPDDDDGQVFSVLVEDEPGVLSRTASLLSGRGYNIKSLAVSPTEVPGLSRMTITVLASGESMKQIIRQVDGVEEVLAVLPSSRVDSVHREVILIKMSTRAPESLSEYDKLIFMHTQRTRLMQLAEMFKAEVVDVGAEHMTFELTAWPKRIDGLIELARPYGIVEVARSGVVAMPRSKIASAHEKTSNDEVIDLSQLPPS